MRYSLRYLKDNIEKLKEKDFSVSGWIRQNRDQKEFGFINLNDGTTIETLQVVYEINKLTNYEEVSKYRVGSSILVKGKVVLTPDSKQLYELNAVEVTLLGDCPEDYPIQPKRHTREFLREKGHLRVRTSLFQAVFKVRSVAAYAVHKFFNERNFCYVNTPIITASDCEGAGQMFNVTTFDLNKIPLAQNNEIDYKKDFFGKRASLTVSGQLEAETFAFGFRDVYTFGPTFRAENSNTLRHASEFWMIEPEICFADLSDDMQLVEEMIKSVVSHVLEACSSEIKFLNDFVDKTLMKKLTDLLKSDFNKITHKEAIDILLMSNVNFSNKPTYEDDLGSEHEKYLTEVHFKAPVFVIDWPKEIKAFYMRLNDDNKTVAAMDLLVPGSGELVGGSQREERLEFLEKRMKEMNVSDEELGWYLDLRRFGSCKHAGFGLGFERLVMYLTGVENIKDVIPFPRTPKNCEF